MKKVQIPIILTSSVLLIYSLTPFIVPFYLVFFMLLILNGLYFWMVYSILKFGKPSGRTFTEFWYDDAGIRKIPDEN